MLAGLGLRTCMRSHTHTQPGGAHASSTYKAEVVEWPVAAKAGDVRRDVEAVRAEVGTVQVCRVDHLLPCRACSAQRNGAGSLQCWAQWRAQCGTHGVHMCWAPLFEQHTHTHTVCAWIRIRVLAAGRAGAGASKHKLVCVLMSSACLGADPQWVHAGVHHPPGVNTGLHMCMSSHLHKQIHGEGCSCLSASTQASVHACTHRRTLAVAHQPFFPCTAAAGR